MTTIAAAAAKELFDELDCDHGSTVEEDDAPVIDGWRLVASYETDAGRWHQRYYLVLANDADELWGLSYGVGLTEYQENDLPWTDAGGAMLPLTRLYAHQVTRTEYRTKRADGGEQP